MCVYICKINVLKEKYMNINYYSYGMSISKALPRVKYAVSIIVNQNLYL